MALRELNDLESNLRDTCLEHLVPSGEGSATLQDISDTVATLARLAKFAPLTAAQLQIVIAHIEYSVTIELAMPDVEVHSDDAVPITRQVTWQRWQSYRLYLRDNGFEPNVIERLASRTSSILDLMGDPATPGKWSRYGMVLGDVQSGKTATYIGLINRAADAGYKIIVVVGGHTEGLRQQTQQRIDEGFIGRNSAQYQLGPGNVVGGVQVVGVGEYLNGKCPFPTFKTSVNKDFEHNQLTGGIDIADASAAPLVVVVKKNYRILQNLRDWIKAQATDGSISVPLLLLDDECDYASVNTSKDWEANKTAVNEAIRVLMETSERSAYVGFTATPFANVFIDDKVEGDLFPRDFIVQLEAPSNYVGVRAVFGDGSSADSVSSRGITFVTDCEEVLPLKHKKDIDVDRLPGSLLEAIDHFLLTNAVRDLLQQTLAPRSMLINASRFMRVQREIFQLVVTYVSNQKDLLASDTKVGSPTYLRFKSRFEELFPLEKMDFNEIWSQLSDSVAGIECFVVNSETSSSDEFTKFVRKGNGRAIVVGGNVLSRGVTLAGLSTSYFYRSVMAYDTLLQMGRWFGYRDHYAHLCRIWMQEDAADWFVEVAESIEELRQELAEMARIGAKPRDFGLAVRTHPGSLMLTALNKRRAAGQAPAREVSLSNRSLEVTRFSTDSNVLADNLKACMELLTVAQQQLQLGTGNANRLLFSGVSTEHLASFVRAFKPTESDKNAVLWQEPLALYVKEGLKRYDSKFDLVLVGGDGPAIRDLPAGSGSVKTARRKLEISNGDIRVHGNKGRISGAKDLYFGIPEERRAELQAEFSKHVEETDKMSRLSQDSYIRSKLDRPLLLMYIVTPSETIGKFKEDSALLATVHMAFPGPAIGKERRDSVYLVNGVWESNVSPILFEDIHEDDDDVE